MKDCRLSEIKEYCKHRYAKFENPCFNCEYNALCLGSIASLFDKDIESCDIIELP